jgi:hypothetical protein
MPTYTMVIKGLSKADVNVIVPTIPIKNPRYSVIPETDRYQAVLEGLE